MYRPCPYFGHFVKVLTPNLRQIEHFVKLFGGKMGHFEHFVKTPLKKP